MGGSELRGTPIWVEGEAEPRRVQLVPYRRLDIHSDLIEWWKPGTSWGDRHATERGEVVKRHRFGPETVYAVRLA